MAASVRGQRLRMQIFQTDVPENVHSIILELFVEGSAERLGAVRLHLWQFPVEPAPRQSGGDGGQAARVSHALRLIRPASDSAELVVHFERRRRTVAWLNRPPIVVAATTPCTTCISSGTQCASLQPRRFCEALLEQLTPGVGAQLLPGGGRQQQQQQQSTFEKLRAVAPWTAALFLPTGLDADPLVTLPGQ